MGDGQRQLDQARRRMLQRDLAGRGIRSTAVLEAMRRVPREQFVSPEARHLAYSDQALGIDCGQTISQPFIVALMTEALQLDRHQRVLEVGTGSGYQTAVLAELAGEVYTIERHTDLSEQAQQRLASLGYDNIHFRVGDGTLGWPEQAPFDGIIITAATANCPPALWEQLVDGGRLVGPFGSEAEQTLELRRRYGDRPVVAVLTPCRFVPLIADPPE